VIHQNAEEKEPDQKREGGRKGSAGRACGSPALSPELERSRPPWEPPSLLIEEEEAVGALMRSTQMELLPLTIRLGQDRRRGCSGLSLKEGESYENETHIPQWSSSSTEMSARHA